MSYPVFMKGLRLIGLTLLGSVLLSNPAASKEDCRNPADDADVIFDGKALSSEGTQTKMRVLWISRGQIEGKEILFKHLVKTELKEGEMYRIFAKRAPDAGSYSELWGAPYCSATVLPLDNNSSR